VLREAEITLQFLFALSGMKRIPRSGWLSHEISLPDVESVAEHTFSTCTLAMMLADLETRRQAQVDVERVVRMALLHDLAESLTFDISQAYLSHMGGRGEEIKREVEDKAWSHLLRELGDSELARNYSSLQNEYIRAITKESKIVHAADSLDMLLQVLDYVRRGYPRRLLTELWEERRRMVSRSGVPSAKRVLGLIALEYEKLR